jgi:hypothetical protein
MNGNEYIMLENDHYEMENGHEKLLQKSYIFPTETELGEKHTGHIIQVQLCISLLVTSVLDDPLVETI